MVKACHVSLIFSKEVVGQLSFFIYFFTAAILIGNSADEISLNIFLFHSILQILLHRMVGYIIICKISLSYEAFDLAPFHLSLPFMI